MKRNGGLIRSSWNVVLVLMCVGCCASCSSTHEHSRLVFSRYSDSVRVALDPNHSSTWSPNNDSVVVECTECYQNKSMATLRFQDRNNEYLSSDASQIMTFKLYHCQKLDTTYVLNADELIDLDPGAGTSLPRHQTTPSHHTVTRTPSDQVKKVPATDTKIVTKKATMLKIIAKEGVAIYKDKSKREVIKILPLGAMLPYLSKEGDLYSVVIDDMEGFVEADAVQIAP